MSDWGKVPQDAAMDGRLTGRDLRVLIFMCAAADGSTGLCRIKQSTVAEKIKTDRVGVLRSLRKLVELGYLTAHQPNGMRRSLQYRVLNEKSTGGQMCLFVAGEAPRQGKVKPSRSGPRATSKRGQAAASDVASKATTDVASKATPIEQTSFNREPVGSAAQRERAIVDHRPDERTATADADRLEATLRDAAGPTINASHPAFLNLAEPLGWLAAGCDLALDVVPVLRGIAVRHTGPPVKSWRYFAGAVAEARDRRLAIARSAPSVRPVATVHCNVVAFDPRGSHVPPRQAKGRFTDAADRRRRQFAGAPSGGADDPP